MPANRMFNGDDSVSCLSAAIIFPLLPAALAVGIVMVIFSHLYLHVLYNLVF